jgi:hypothetical protein
MTTTIRVAALPVACALVLWGAATGVLDGFALTLAVGIALGTLAGLTVGLVAERLGRRLPGSPTNGTPGWARGQEIGLLVGGAAGLALAVLDAIVGGPWA